jgi:hypothetical protein
MSETKFHTHNSRKRRICRICETQNRLKGVMTFRV